MKAIDLKQLLDNYDNDTEVLIYVSDRYQTLSFTNINIDEEVPKNQAVALSINIDEEDDYYYIECDNLRY